MHFLTVLALLPLASCAPAALTNDAPLSQSSTAQLVPGRYIVKLKDDTSVDELHATVSTLGGVGKVSHVYGGGHFKGFATELDAKNLEDLRQHPGVSDNVRMAYGAFSYCAIKYMLTVPQVERIEQDAIVSINKYVTQTDAPWGLGRISHKTTGSDENVYDDSAGEGTCAYIIDTGVYTEHNVCIFSCFRSYSTPFKFPFLT